MARSWDRDGEGARQGRMRLARRRVDRARRLQPPRLPGMERETTAVAPHFQGGMRDRLIRALGQEGRAVEALYDVRLSQARVQAHALTRFYQCRRASSLYWHERFTEEKAGTSYEANS